MLEVKSGTAVVSEKHLIDAINTIDAYLERADWRVNANANQGFSGGGLILNSFGKLAATYWLDKIFSPEEKEAHVDGWLHIHDLDFLGGYCAGWSLKDLIIEGFNGVPNKVASGPAKHLSTVLHQMVNFLGTLQNEWAGAQAFSSVDTLLAPFVRIDNLSFKETKQKLQEFVFSLNTPSRWGSQTPFINLTFDLTVPDDLKDEHPIIGGEVLETTYADYQSEMDMINKAFVELMIEGDYNGRIFSFPIPTYSLTKDFDWEGEVASLIFKMTAKYGTPYFQNYINSDLNPSDTRSMCCRLRLDLQELRKRGGGLFGSSDLTGSIGVVTINLAKLGYLYAGNIHGLYKKLDELLVLAKNILEKRRKTVLGFLEKGLLPFSKRYLKRSLDNHFSTIGVNGANEMVLNFTKGRINILSEEGKKMSEDILKHINGQLLQFQQETENLYNLEASPAESATYRFAKVDRALYKDIIQAGTETAPYYTNSTQPPVDEIDPLSAVVQQESLQLLYTGGTVQHIFLQEKISTEQCKHLLQHIVFNFKIPYISITPTFSICPTHGYLTGTHETCPECGSVCEVWTRVMGYYRPVSQFNKGKYQEYVERKYARIGS